MRKIPASLKERIEKALQAKSTNAQPAAVVWLTRPTVVLRENEFLERQKVSEYASLTQASIAARHLHTNEKVDRLYLGYVSNGVAKVLTAMATPDMADHTWFDTGFSKTASAMSVEFDGYMPKTDGGTVEYITDEEPWVFWVNNGVLTGQVLNSNSTEIILATENVTEVSAVRAMWSEVGGFDFGLICFFIMSGQLYYRQLIDGEWTNAETVTSVAGVNLTALTFTQLATSRTWDYRIAVQLKDSTGAMHEIITQYFGIAKQTAEHIEITGLVAEGNILEVTYHDENTVEHLQVSDISAESSLTYGLTSRPINAANMDDGSGNWGTLLQVVFDYPISNTAGNFSSFILTDGNNVNYTVTAISLSESGKVLTVTVSDFNLAAYAPNCKIKYTQGTILSPVVMLENFAFDFIPTNLVAPPIDPPQPESLWNE